jgi:hypothetical protein
MAIRRLALAAAVATTVLLMMAQPAAASWLEQNTPAPPGATNWQFSAVSCTSPTSCMAVGSTNNSLLAEQRTGSTWRIVSIPGSGQLNGISCASATACEAVGQTGSGSGNGVFAERWDGMSWTVQTPQLPAGATSSQLSAVSCTSATACEAVGQFSSGGTAKTLAEVWSGSTWTIQATPNAASQTSNGLLGVSCISATACEAVGSSFTGTTNVTLAEAWNGTNWAIQTTPNAAGGVNRLDGVSCTAATACMAVGTTAERWDGTHWTLLTIAQPRGDAPAELDRVSCADRNHCMAAGSFFNKEAIQTLVAEHWNGTKWQVQATPITSVNDSSFLTDVSCVQANSCTAVGASHNPLGHNQALVEDWSLRWQDQSPAFPPGAIAGGLDKVSCTAFSACVAVGGTEVSSSLFEPLTEIWNGHTWTAEPTPNPGASNLAAVACTAATSCTAVGDALAGGGVATLAERWDGTSWTMQTTPNPAGATRSFLLGVSCTAANACTAVGFYDDSAGNQLTLAERWDGANWTIQATPNPAGSTTSQLNEVSCRSATACTAVGSASGQTWAEAWNGTNWTIQNTPIPAGGSDPALHGVACTAPNACTAVGSFFNGTRTVPLADRWNGTRWAAQKVAVPAGSTASGLASVSCASAKASTACNAVGFSTSDSGQAAVAENWNGTKWSVLGVPTFGNPPSDLTGVSCSSLTACISVGSATDTSDREAPLAEQYS